MHMWTRVSRLRTRVSPADQGATAGQGCTLVRMRLKLCGGSEVARVKLSPHLFSPSTHSIIS